jgi:RIO kinase 1
MSVSLSSWANGPSQDITTKISSDNTSSHAVSTSLASSSRNNNDEHEQHDTNVVAQPAENAASPNQNDYIHHSAHANVDIDDEDDFDFDMKDHELAFGGVGTHTSSSSSSAAAAAAAAAAPTRSAASSSTSTSTSSSSSASSSSTPKPEKLSRLNKMIYLGDLRTKSTVTQRVHTSVSDTERRLEKAGIRRKDKADRATVEQVLDRRTRLILAKFINGDVISEIHGCVSTGKEANVYFATGPDGGLAVKIFKTSILVFKDRDRYVSGEFRFRQGYNRHNPRQMVKTWAEKEMRNLKRIYAAGIPAPKPVKLKSHVLVMTFVGEDGWPAPRLHNAKLTDEEWRECYVQVVKYMRTMFHVCHLVHADLSEYNMLWYNKKAYIIDVSQSVEHEHPRSLEFLRMDATNVTTFFANHGVQVMPVRTLFDFVMMPELPTATVDEYLDEIEHKLDTGTLTSIQTAAEEVDHAVFMRSFIPRSLQQAEFYHGSDETISADDNSVIAQAMRNMTVDKSNADESDEDEDEDGDDENDTFVQDAKHQFDGATTTLEDVAEDQEENGGDGDGDGDDDYDYDYHGDANDAEYDDGDDDYDDDDGGESTSSRASKAQITPDGQFVIGVVSGKKLTKEQRKKLKQQVKLMNRQKRKEKVKKKTKQQQVKKSSHKRKK